jgi:hypothetical protein
MMLRGARHVHIDQRPPSDPFFLTHAWALVLHRAPKQMIFPDTYKIYIHYFFFLPLHTALLFLDLLAPAPRRSIQGEL